MRPIASGSLRMAIELSWRTARSVALLGATLMATVAASTGAVAQALKDIRTPDTPLVLESRGSFFVGGDVVQQSFVELGSKVPADQITVNQMYVEYMIPATGKGIPVVMIHGSTLSGKTYDTTPDGRMGWYEYFVRRGHPVYVPDQVGRGRSGFNQAIFNNVAQGIVPPAQQPRLTRLADRVGVWKNMRFGPNYPETYPNERFPVEAIAELSKQDIPDFNLAVPTPNPTFKALSDLAIQVKGAVLLGHSQSGAFPMQAALVNPAAIKGFLLIEPGNCGTYTPEQIAILARIPALVVFGDHTDAPTGIESLPFLWRDALASCKAFIAQINAAHGNASLLSPAELGPGNSHMIMQDKNNLEVADRMLDWLDRNVKAKK
jgi:pimeloyl-ACP methyl ester carboxylesterase